MNSGDNTAAEAVHEFTFSTGRKAAIKELSGFEQFTVDRCAQADGDMALLMYSRAAASLVRLDGVKHLAPIQNYLHLEERLKYLKARESDELVREYGRKFTSFADAGELKNSSAVGDSQPS